MTDARPSATPRRAVVPDELAARRVARAMARDLAPLLRHPGAAVSVERACHRALDRADCGSARADVDLFGRLRPALRPETADLAYDVIDAWLSQGRALRAGEPARRMRPHRCRGRDGGGPCSAAALPGSLYCPGHRLPPLRRAIDVA